MPEPELTPRKSPRQRRSVRTVDRIVDAATRVFDDLGYLDTTTNEIAAEAGVSIGSLYQYFPNKDALLVEIARRHVAASLEAFDSLIDGLGHPIGLQQTIRAVVDLLVAGHERDRVHLLIAHQAPRTEELNRELRRAHEHFVSAADHLLEGRIRLRERRNLAARMMVAVLDAAIHDVILRQPRGPQRNAAIAMTTSTVMAIAEI